MKIGKEVGEAVGSIFEPIAGLIGELNTSDEEEMRARAALLEAKSAAQAKLFELQQRVILAEAKGDSQLQRNWRPILMLVIVAILANNFILSPYLAAMFGWSVDLKLPDPLWQLLMIGVGGYVAGRSVEKTVRNWKNPTKEGVE